jgi:hypothetical protein
MCSVPNLFYAPAVQIFSRVETVFRIKIEKYKVCFSGKDINQK